ncbi:hypothetical protein RhiirA5_430008 [Rhizophagus irregularis]|uniref:Uncharacterized protein n=1 Tax=Rhizophagus irregularis TaxID=588596 RepID=A0A2N0NXF9_9GLOM|nr:hypothetical protein RhiirA5_430008 [Rhizophagus irregularis]
MSLIITLLLCTILSDININFIAETERKRKVKEAHLQAPIPDKSSSTSSNVILTERRADVQLVTSQIQEDSRNSGGNKSSTIMTRSSSTKEKNN